MGSITLNLKDDELSVLTAYATITSGTIEALVASRGVTGAVNEALNNEVQHQVTVGNVSTDIKNELVKDAWIVQQKVNNLYSQGTIPASIISGIVSRAASV